MRLCQAQERVQPLGRHRDVIVDDDDQSGAGGCDPYVHRAGEAEVRSGFDDGRPPDTARDRVSDVALGVVQHEHDLVWGAGVLRADRPEAIEEERRRRPGHDDDRDGWIGHLGEDNLARDVHGIDRRTAGTCSTIHRRKQTGRAGLPPRLPG